MGTSSNSEIERASKFCHYGRHCLIIRNGLLPALHKNCSRIEGRLIGYICAMINLPNIG